MGNRTLSKVNLRVSDSWVLEIAACLLAFVSLTIIIVLLSVYTGRPQFSFAGVTLNTVIAVLAACVRIGLILPVSEGLAQWKWLWFSKQSQPLSDFATLDEASRGTRGSLMLLWETKGLSLTSIGAAIVLLSVATEPFIQQTINFREDLIFATNSNVQIPYSQSWSGGSEIASPPGTASSSTGGNNLTTIVDEYGVVSDVQLDNPGQAAVQFGLNAVSSQAVAGQLPSKCPSGNCTWPAFNSLAVCSKCTNLNDKIQTSSALNYPMAWFFPTPTKSQTGNGPENLTSYYLPNGLNLNNRKESYYASSEPVMLTSKATLRPSETITFQNSTTLLFSTSVLRVPPSDFPVGGTWQSTHIDISAVECGLYLCIKEYNSKVVDGSLVEDSKEIAATRDPDSFSVQLDDAGTLSFPEGKVSPDVDALYSNVTFFPRTALVIKMPPMSNSSNLNNKQVDIPQRAIDSLSSYILSIFDEGTYFNTSTSSEDTGCSFGASSIPCAGPQNISGMAIGNSSLLVKNTSSPTVFSPTVTKLLYNSNDLGELFNNVANSITNEMRRNADNQPSLSGELGTLKTVLDVRWAWIAFPAFLVVSSLLFFVIAMVESHRQAVPLWKSSTLAVLCHGIEEKVRDPFTSIERASGMEHEAAKVDLRLRRGGSNEALMLRPDSHKSHSIELQHQGSALLAPVEGG